MKPSYYVIILLSLISTASAEAPPATTLPPEVSSPPIEATPKVVPVSPEADFRTGVGVALGALSGIGISFRTGFSETFGFRIAGLGWATTSTSYANLGLNFLPSVWSRQGLRVYLPFGFGLTYSGNGGTVHNTTVVAGGGLGVEVLSKTLFNQSTQMRIGVGFELPFVVIATYSSLSLWSLSAYPIPSLAVILYL